MRVDIIGFVEKSWVCDKWGDRFLWISEIDIIGDIKKLVWVYRGIEWL